MPKLKYAKLGNTELETDFTSLGNTVSKLSEVYSNSIYVGYMIFQKFEYVKVQSKQCQKVSKDER